MTQDKSVDAVMGKDRIKQTNQLSASVASALVLTMKWKSSIHTHYKAYEAIGSAKECTQRQPDVEQQRQALPFKL